MRVCKSKVNSRRLSGLAAIAAAISSATPVWAGTSSASVNPGANAVTISMSGSTAMRNFTISSGFSLLNPGDSITLLSGVSGAPVTYQAATGASTSVQLAAGDFTTGVDANPAVPGAVTTANYAGLRLEWHEQGSVEGIFELADAQIDDGIYSNNPTLNPNGAIATFVNRNKWLGTSSPGAALGVTQGGHLLNGFASANDRTTAQIQNRVQMAISDVNAAQGFSRAGTGAFNLTPGMNGYGKGNPALTAAGNVSGIGLANSRHALLDETQLNMTTGTIDPGTIPGNVGSGGTTYASGPWNSAGVGNLHNERVAVTATTFAANPGTGLTRLNRTDAQWLQSTGRLANGADFNITTRDVNSGTLNVASSNVGLDPSWAAGENDGGTGGGTSEDNIGTGIKFSNKSSGGSNLRPVVQNSRMAIGHLSLSDYRGGGSNNGNRPTRALDYRDDADDLSNGSNGSFPDPGTGSSTTTVGAKTYQVSRSGFAPVNAYNIVNGNYAVWQNETYVTAKDVTQGATVMSQFVTDFTAAEGGAPTAQQQADLWSGKKITGGGGRTYILNDNPTVKTVAGLDTTYGTSIKGDNHSAGGNDVYDVRKNILGAVANFPAGSIANPADALINTSFILPQFMVVEKDRDGVGQTFANPSYNSTLSNAFLGSASLSLNFDTNGTTTAAAPKGPADVTIGDGTSTYGNVSPTQGAILIIENSGSTKANWMFGNFRQNLVRDYAAVKAAADAQIALQGSGLGVDMFAGAAGSNNSPVGGLAAALQSFHGTSNAFKGDLIAMGDYNSDGKFDGKDLYLLARGAALSDAAGVGSGYATGELTTFSGGIANDFGDWARRGVLRKNDALDYMAGLFPGGTAQAIAASANATNDPTGANAFNKRDVNRDGFVNFVDAVTSDKFIGKNYTNLQNQLDATGNVRDWETPTPISLVDAELNDTGNINQSDLDVINTALTGAANETWTTGTLMKTGAGTVSVGYTSGTVKVNAGAILLISNGTVDVGGTQDIFTDNTGSGTNGNHVAVINNATSSLIISAGGKLIATLSGVGNTSVAAGASLTTDYARQNQLTVNGTVNIRSAVAANTKASIVNTLAIGPAGQMDLSNQDLIAHATPVGSWNGSAYTDLTGRIASGRNGGAWNGPGLITSQSAAQGSNFTSLGIGKASDVLPNTASATAVWNGQTITGTDTLVMYTYGGDATLDGKINVDDYIKIDSGIAAGLTGWSNGDFNYDGKINIDDYTTVIDANIGNQTGSLAGGSGIGGGSLTSRVSAVPEPGAVGLISATAALSLRRGSRRRRR